jgi:uroporphyrinogen decarboxylase
MSMKPRTLSERDNYLRTLEFGCPEWIPIKFELMPAMWLRYGAQLQQLVERHPLVFAPDDPGGYSFNFHEGDPFYTANETFTDEWGCGWRNTQAGLLGQVVQHPLADWQALDTYRPPDPGEQYDWRALKEATDAVRRAGRLTQGTYDFVKGGFFDRLQFLRGLENLLVDFMEEPPQLWTLIEMVLDYNMRYIRQWLDIGVDLMFFHGDVGSQKNLIMSPATFRKYLKPAYTEMFGSCRRAGSHVWYSSDGHMLPVVDDLVECGVSLHDPQVRANTIEGIAGAYKGKLCALVDIDEQMLPTCKPEEIKQQIRDVREAMYQPQGGLMIYCIPSQDVPLENIEALCQGWEEICWM